MKIIDQQTGEDLEVKQKAPSSSRCGRSKSTSRIAGFARPAAPDGPSTSAAAGGIPTSFFPRLAGL